MNIIRASDILGSSGFIPPVLNALIPNEANYKTLIMQSSGEIEWDAAGVRHRNHVLASMQFSSFLEIAMQSGSDLVVTPEYSMPWGVLSEAIKNSLVPECGKVWVLGCESIKYSELISMRDDLLPHATLLFEHLHPDVDRFTDPLAYVFKASSAMSNGATKTVILVQFKTHPMGDPKHFEVNGMQRGNCVYVFQNSNQSIRLLSLICSDALAFTDKHAKDVYDRTLIIHIQMNAEPRHSTFRGCRERLLKYGGDQTEILCLNWAAIAHDPSAEHANRWQTHGFSAWYLKAKEFDHDDGTLEANHKRGLYYSWLKTLYTHVLIFNFRFMCCLLEVSKVVHIGVPGPNARRRGPQLTKSYIWDDTHASWSEPDVMDDGFSGILDEIGGAKDDLNRIAIESPMEAERVLALSAGEVCGDERWYDVMQLDSCALTTDEVIRRITFAQDTEDEARKFRIARLKRFATLWEIIRKPENVPPALIDLTKGFRFIWSYRNPHQNVVAVGGKTATVVYMGEGSGLRDTEETLSRLTLYIQRTGPDVNESHSRLQRLVVWYRDGNGHIVPFDLYRSVKIDNSGVTSPVDVAKEN